ncbi:MAG: hypothetical protein ACLRLD_06145 [Lachnospira sp.]
MKIIIKIIDNDKIIDFDCLTEAQKQEYGKRLNAQAMEAMGYVPEKQ